MKNSKCYEASVRACFNSINKWCSLKMMSDSLFESILISLQCLIVAKLKLFVKN
jgi:hypothetical protein